jgi:hypothetical protein
MSRLYVVTHKSIGVDRLIRANSQAQAIGFVTKGLLSATAASAEDVAKLMALSTAIEDATAPLTKGDEP